MRCMLTAVENVQMPGFTSFMLNTYLIVLDSSLNTNGMCLVLLILI